MSKYIPTRTPIQCRSHHQKLIAKYRNFKKIITSFKNEIGEETYDREFSNFIKEYKPIEDFSSSAPEKANDSASELLQKTVETQT